MELTVIGSEPAWPSALRACSGYLIRTGDTTILVDCGTGVFERLRALLAPENVDDIVISHLHFDHWVDLIPYRYYLQYEAKPAAPPRLHLPPGGREILEKLVQPIDAIGGFFENTFRVDEYDPSTSREIGGLGCAFHQTRHPIDAYAFRFTAGDRTLAYSADTGWLESLADFARDADLFLCEAGWAGGPSGGDFHLTGAEAGRLASLAGANSLLLTHVAEREAGFAVEAAKTEYGGEVRHARAGDTFQVQPAPPSAGARVTRKRAGT